MKHPQFLTDILNHPDISQADKDTAKAEVERMMSDVEYRAQVKYEDVDGSLWFSFVWSDTESGENFWFQLYIKYAL
jgi:hypothetical protein